MWVQRKGLIQQCTRERFLKNTIGAPFSHPSTERPVRPRHQDRSSGKECGEEGLLAAAAGQQVWTQTAGKRITGLELWGMLPEIPDVGEWLVLKSRLPRWPKSLGREPPMDKQREIPLNPLPWIYTARSNPHSTVQFSKCSQRQHFVLFPEPLCRVGRNYAFPFFSS